MLKQCHAFGDDELFIKIQADLDFLELASSVRGKVLHEECFSLMRKKGGGYRQVGVQPGAGPCSACNLCDFFMGRQPGSGLVA